MSNDCCPTLPDLSGPMPRSNRFIVCIPIHSIPDDSSRRHGENRTFHLSLDLFHLSVAEVLGLVLAEEQLQRLAMVLLMMLSLLLRCPVLVLLSVLPLICQLPVLHVHDIGRNRGHGVGDCDQVGF